MLYHFVKILTNIFYRIYYKLEVIGKSNVPVNQPIILAPNHTNAFVDPTVLAMTLPQKVRFFARGDVFKGAIAKWALNELSISPMYRLQEGYSEVKKNDKTFEECRNLLSQNKTILIFPEAICIQEKRLQPLKKGLTRIVFQTEEQFDFKKNVWVLPVGLNYSNAPKFGSRLAINIGKPISVKHFEEQFKVDKVKTINEFTKQLESEMAKLIIVINNPAHDELVEKLTEIYLQEWMKSKNYDLKSREKQFVASKEIVEMINYHDVQNPEAIESLKEKTIAYTHSLKKLELRDHLLQPESINKMGISSLFKDFFVMWFGLPLYGIGMLLNYFPYFVSKKFADQKIRKKEFYASIYLNMSMLLWVVYYAIQLLAIALILRNWWILGAFSLIIPATGYYAFKFYPTLKKINGRWQLLGLVKKEKTTIEKLMTERTTLFAEIDLMKQDYLNSLQKS